MIVTVACAAEAAGQSMLDRPESPLIEPREGSAPKKVILPAERSMVVNRKAQLAMDEKTGWYKLTFLSESGKSDEAPRYALSNTRLERIEEILKERPDAVFTISGETTNYEKKAFLLIRLAVAEVPAEPASQKAVEVLPTTVPTQPATAVAKSQPATAAGKGSTSPDDIIHAMLEERPGTPVLAPSELATPIKVQPSVAPLPKPVQLQLPTMFGTMLNDRLVRLAQDKEGWWIIRFESDNTLQDQPIRVLPNSKLTEARKLSVSKTGVEIRLTVSGELMQYKGEQYILIRRVEKYHPMGQF